MEGHICESTFEQEPVSEKGNKVNTLGVHLMRWLQGKSSQEMIIHQFLKCRNLMASNKFYRTDLEAQGSTLSAQYVAPSAQAVVRDQSLIKIRV